MRRRRLRRRVCCLIWRTPLRRTYYPITLARTLEFCAQLARLGPGAVDAQNAMQRLSLDVIMIAGFGVDPHAVDFQECEILDSLHFCFEEIFRCAALLRKQCPARCA